MQEKFYALLDGREIDGTRVSVTIDGYSITIEEIDEEGYNLYGEKFYNAHDAVFRLQQLGALI